MACLRTGSLVAGLVAALTLLSSVVATGAVRDRRRHHAHRRERGSDRRHRTLRGDTDPLSRAPPWRVRHVFRDRGGLGDIHVAVGDPRQAPISITAIDMIPATCPPRM